MDAFDRQSVVAFLDQSGDYVPASGQIVGILKQMKETLEGNLQAAEKDEASSAAGFADLESAKTEEIAVAGSAIEDKMQRSGNAAVAAAESQNALDDSEEEDSDEESDSDDEEYV